MPHLVKQGKASQTCSQRPLIDLVDSINFLPLLPAVTPLLPLEDSLWEVSICVMFQTSCVRKLVKGMRTVKCCYAYTASHCHRHTHMHARTHAHHLSHGKPRRRGQGGVARLVWLGSARTLRVVAVVAVARLARCPRSEGAAGASQQLLY